VCKNAGKPHTCYRQTKPDIGWMALENDAKAVDIKLTLFKLSLFNYLGARVTAWRKQPAWKHGHWEHLDVTHETSDCARGEYP
jgi:hypothetical protein